MVFPTFPGFGGFGEGPPGPPVYLIWALVSCPLVGCPCWGWVRGESRPEETAQFTDVKAVPEATTIFMGPCCSEDSEKATWKQDLIYELQLDFSKSADLSVQCQ